MIVMNIGIDIDGIILDFERTMRTCAEMYDLFFLNKNGVINPNEFDYLKRYDWTNEERKFFIDNFLVYATLNYTPLIPLVKEMLEFFKLEGYNSHFITARGSLKQETKYAVIEVFNRNGIVLDNVHWGVKDKVSKCKELSIDIMIEDKPSTCIDLRNNNIMTLFFRDKGNQVLEESEFLKEVSNVGEIVRFFVSNYGLKNEVDVYKKLLLK